MFTPQPLPPALKLVAAGVLLLAFLGYVWRGGRATAPGGAGAVDPAPSAAGPPRRVPAVPDRGRSAPAGAIRLPEGLALRLEPAGVPSRALALIIDTGILAAMAGLGLLGAAAVFGGLPGDWAAAASAVFAALFFGLYGFLFEWLGGGATPGKRALHLRVLRDDGRPAGPGSRRAGRARGAPAASRVSARIAPGQARVRALKRSLNTSQNARLRGTSLYVAATPSPNSRASASRAGPSDSPARRWLM